MATNQTTTYQLNQWEPTDQVLRTDFNADNAKLDAALANKAETETVSALQTTVAAKAEQTALSALAARVTALEARPYIVTGTYTGDGTASRFISLGFTPKALLVFTSEGYPANPYIDYYLGGMAFPNLPVEVFNRVGDLVQVLELAEGGFRIFYDYDLGLRSNQKDTKYYYMAWI